MHCPPSARGPPRCVRGSIDGARARRCAHDLRGRLAQAHAELRRTKRRSSTRHPPTPRREADSRIARRCQGGCAGPSASRAPPDGAPGMTPIDIIVPVSRNAEAPRRCWTACSRRRVERRSRWSSSTVRPRRTSLRNMSASSGERPRHADRAAGVAGVRGGGQPRVRVASRPRQGAAAIGRRSVPATGWIASRITARPTKSVSSRRSPMLRAWRCIHRRAATTRCRKAIRAHRWTRFSRTRMVANRLRFRRPTVQASTFGTNASRRRRVDGAPLGGDYGVEIDFCLRAACAGFRHVVAGDVFVVHTPHASFGNRKRRSSASARRKRCRSCIPRTSAAEQIAERDPMRTFGRRVDLLRLAELPKQIVVFVSHKWAGGIRRYMNDLAALI